MADVTKDLDAWEAKGELPADLIKTVTVGDKAQQCVDLTGGKSVSTFAAGTAGMGIIGNFKVDAVDGAELGGGAAWGWTLVRPFASTRGVGQAGGLRTTTA
ncbi:hypothetical protein GCM10009827_108950 [Dactylosporangium maewongense]|uniref:Uncharacterized protein n=1 Tax=Dactylosporangium maewongense TaxID=634393 RepID=A0ABN2D6P7_9ACTN